ncbi:MAG: EF-hand domain-containing protein [Cyanobacteria bacterium P01_H01_bin.74]
MSSFENYSISWTEAQAVFRAIDSDEDGQITRDDANQLSIVELNKKLGTPSTESQRAFFNHLQYYYDLYIVAGEGSTGVTVGSLSESQLEAYANLSGSNDITVGDFDVTRNKIAADLVEKFSDVALWIANREDIFGTPMSEEALLDKRNDLIYDFLKGRAGGFINTDRVIPLAQLVLDNFATVDTNDDGEVGADEITALDTNANGRITAAEFSAAQ